MDDESLDHQSSIVKADESSPATLLSTDVGSPSSGLLPCPRATTILSSSLPASPCQGAMATSSFQQTIDSSMIGGGDTASQCSDDTSINMEDVSLSSSFKDSRDNKGSVSRRNGRKRIREDSMSSSSDSYESLVDTTLGTTSGLESGNYLQCKPQPPPQQSSSTPPHSNSPSSPSSNQQQQVRDWLSIYQQWSNADRMSALEALVTDERFCDIQSIRFLLSIIEPQLQRDFISLLPKELALYVLSFLDPTDLLKAAQTCRYWRILCEDNLLWREKCREEGLLDDNETIVDLFRKRTSRQRRSHLSHHQRTWIPPSSQAGHSSSCGGGNATYDSPTTSRDPTTPVASPPDPSESGPSMANCSDCSTSSSITSPPSTPAFVPSEYKLGFLRQKSIEYNWRYGIFPTDPDTGSAVANAGNAVAGALGGNTSGKKTTRYLKPILQLKGHDDHVITCLQFNPASNLIVSGSDDNTLKVWSSITGKCLRTLTGHTGGVWSSQLSPSDIVISGSTDRTLKVWNALSGECLHTFYGHTSTVRCMALHENFVVSGSRDATLRVWDITSGECCHVLVGHVGAVRCVQFNGKIVVSGAYDFLVKVWDVASETCLHTLEGHTNRVYSLQFDGENIVSGSLDTSIKVWSATTGTLRHTLMGHESLTSGMQLRGNILVSGNADSTVKVWDITTGQCLATLAGVHKHRSAVTCLQFNARFVITSSDDGTVKLWDLKTGEFVRNLVTLPSGGSGGVVWRIRASNTRLVCAVGSRNGTEETKLLVLDFDNEQTNRSIDIRRHHLTSRHQHPFRFHQCEREKWRSEFSPRSVSISIHDRGAMSMMEEDMVDEDVIDESSLIDFGEEEDDAQGGQKEGAGASGSGHDFQNENVGDAEPIEEYIVD